MQNMKREIIHPESEEHWLQLRKPDLTSSEVGSLFGASKYMTAAKLWHIKKGNIEDDFKGNERTEWGLALESAIVEKMFGSGLGVRNKTEYIRIPELRIGSSFDYELGGGELIEVKNVEGWVYQRDWLEDEAPPHIELQVQHQMLVSGAECCHIVACVNGNRGVHLVRYANEGIQQAIVDKAKSFWASIDSGVEPEFNLQDDVELLRQLNLRSKKQEVFLQPDDSMMDLARRYQKVVDMERNLKAKKDEIKSQILIHSRNTGCRVYKNSELTVQTSPRFSVKWRD